MSERFLGSLGLAALLAGVLAGPVLAHGGAYLGPAFPPTPPNLPPGGSGPKGGVSGAPMPSGVPRGTTSGPDSQRWETWWAYNKDEFFPFRGLENLRGTPRPEGYDAGAASAPDREDIRNRVLPVLTDMLKAARETDIRDSAAIALGKIGDDRDVPALEALLGDSERAVVESSILGLGLLRSDRAEQRLVELYRDPSRSARERGFAVVALGLSGGAVAREALFNGLGKPGASPADARSRAADLDAIRALAAGLIGRSDLFAAGSDPAPDPATGHLLKAIADDAVRDATFLPAALAALAKTRDPSARQGVLDGLKNSKGPVRGGAAIAAGRIFRNPDPRTLKTVLAAYDEEGDLFPKRMLLISLGRMGGESARKALESALREKDRQNRAFAAIALGLAGARDLMPSFRAELAAAKDSSLCAAFAVALGLLGDPEAGTQILAMISDRKDPLLRAHLVETLILLQPKGAVPVIQKLLIDTRTPELQATCSLALGLLDPVGSRDLLMKILRESGTTTVKAAVATGLARSGQRAVLDPLLEFVKNATEQPLARAFGVVALGIIGEKNPGLPPFSRWAIDSHYELRIPVIEEVRELL